MKKAAFGIACGFISIFVFVSMLTLYGRAVRQEETNHVLTEAIDSALAGVMSENNYTIADNENFIADFLKALLVQANSDSELTVSVLYADYEYGILSVEITETFLHPNGTEGSVSEVRTVIFDKEQEDPAAELCKVSFYVAEGELYKEYALQKDSLCMVPVPPKKEGKRFRRWRFITGGTGEAGSVEAASKTGSRNVLSERGTPYQVSRDTKLIAVFE